MGLRLQRAFDAIERLFGAADEAAHAPAPRRQAHAEFLDQAPRWSALREERAWTPLPRWEPPRVRELEPVRTAEAAIEMLDEHMRPSLVLTRRRAEVPYGISAPFEVQRIPLGQRVDIQALRPKDTYVWVIDEAGTFHLAPETQPGFGINELLPEGRRLKHGDLTPGAGGLERGAARMGGKLRVLRDQYGGIRQARDGANIWVLDNSSSYSGARARMGPDGELVREPRLDPQALIAVRELLRFGGADVEHLRLADKLRGTIWKGAAKAAARPDAPPPGWTPPAPAPMRDWRTRPPLRESLDPPDAGMPRTAAGA